MKPKHDLLEASFDHLERALTPVVAGQEHAWAEQVEGALMHIRHALLRHAAEAEQPVGLFAEVDLTRPSLARQVGGLLREHDELLHRLRDYSAEVQTAARAFRPPAAIAGQTKILPEADHRRAIPDFGALRQRGVELLATLRHHRRQETELVLESVTTDIGAGD
jgi:hypothetical protein